VPFGDGQSRVSEPALGDAPYFVVRVRLWFAIGLPNGQCPTRRREPRSRRGVEYDSGLNLVQHLETCTGDQVEVDER
jgi:hypothetical protein